jgi:hypothetical protein
MEEFEMRKTIKGLEAEVQMMKNAQEQLLHQITDLSRDKNHASDWARRHVELTDRLLNILEWNAKEGKGYGTRN